MRSIKKVENACWTIWNSIKKTVKIFIGVQHFNDTNCTSFEIEFTCLHVSRDAVKSPITFKKCISCEQTIIIGNVRWILIGNRYHLQCKKMSISSKRLCITSTALQITSNGIIVVNVRQIRIKITVISISGFVWIQKKSTCLLIKIT